MADKSPGSTKRQALGRGLSALIPTEPKSTTDQAPAHFRILSPDQIKVSGTYQPRTHFDLRSIEELSVSISTYGILQPLVVRPIAGSPQTFELIAGERRYRAAKLAKLQEIPVVIQPLKDAEALEIALIENIQRQDLNVIEEARGFLQLADTLNLTQAEIAKRIGKSRVYVTNKIRLLSLPEPAQQALIEQKLSEGHARALLAVQNPKKIMDLVDQINLSNLSVRDIEQLVKKGPSANKAMPKPEDPNWIALARQLEKKLNTKVTIKRRKKGGQLIIHYHDFGILDKIVKKLNT